MLGGRRLRRVIKREPQKLARLFRDEDFGPWTAGIGEFE